MPKANLTLLSASMALNAASTKSVLADECRQLSESDLDAACEALFERKEPYVLLKNVELAVAATHFGQFKALGLDCEIAVLDIEDGSDSNNSGVLRKSVLAGVCVLSVAVGGGYYFHSQKTSQLSPTIAKQSAQVPETVEIAAATQATEFHQWRNRVDGIENLKQELQQLSSDQIRNYFIEHTEDPMARTVGSNYVAQLAIQKPGSQNSIVTEHQQQLENSLTAMDHHPAILDRFYATLELAGVYQQLQNQRAAQSTFELARNFVGADGLNQAPEIVIAEVALAEHQHLYGTDKNRDAHLVAAATAASGIKTGTGNLHEWAVAYIARGEAKFGLFAKAHRRLRTISDEQIVNSVMVDISNYAAKNNNESTVKVVDPADHGFSIDDRDLILKFMNSRTDTE